MYCEGEGPMNMCQVLYFHPKTCIHLLFRTTKHLFFVLGMEKSELNVTTSYVNDWKNTVLFSDVFFMASKLFRY